ncbi:unnamed protein product [Lymnaea stagnalis]|uniref:Uncharacterized protein n=1 Tax=Lymnaea stagnalis TaxID=6523 RepID=A0AAV2IBW6_LYMST
MASKTQAQRFINLINQQIDILKGERKSVLEAVDDAINQVQLEVDTWVNGGLVNQTTFSQMNNRITQVIALFMTKSEEISGLEIKENKSDLNQTHAATSSDSTSPKTNYTREEAQDRTIFSTEKTLNKPDVDASYITTTRFAILEEAVFSLKKTTEQVQDKQEKFIKKMEILTNANIKSKKKFQERLTVLEKRNQEVSSNVDDFFENVSNVDVKLNRLEEENKSVNVSMKELNKQISSVRTCSNEALMSVQNLSKSVESTNQHYNEISHKMNELEMSNNRKSTQYTEKFESKGSLNKDKFDDVIGMVCQLLSKRLFPLEKLSETLNKNVIVSKEHVSEEADGGEKAALLHGTADTWRRGGTPPRREDWRGYGQEGRLLVKKMALRVNVPEGKWPRGKTAGEETATVNWRVRNSNDMRSHHPEGRSNSETRGTIL